MPTPGTTKVERLRENVGAVDLRLSDEEVRGIDEAAARVPLVGARYSEAGERMVDR